MIARFREDLALATAAGTDVVVLMDRVTFCDSSGLGALVGAYKSVRERDRRLVLVGCNERMRAILTRTGLSKLFELHDDVRDFAGASACREPG